MHYSCPMNNAKGTSQKKKKKAKTLDAETQLAIQTQTKYMYGIVRKKELSGIIYFSTFYKI